MRRSCEQLYLLWVSPECFGDVFLRALVSGSLCPISTAAIQALSPNPQGDSVRRCSLWGVMRSWGWSPILFLDGISVLIEGTHFFIWGHREKMASVHPEMGSHSHGICHHLGLGLPASGAVGNKCLLLQPPNPWYFCYSSPNLDKLSLFLCCIIITFAFTLWPQTNCKPLEDSTHAYLCDT